MKRIVTFALAFEQFDEYKKLHIILQKMNALQLSPDTYLFDGEETGQLIRARLSAVLYKDDTFYYISVGKDRKLLIIKDHGLRTR